MDDKQLVELYWARDERSLSITADKYGKYLHTIAMNILEANEDAEEAVNDNYPSYSDGGLR